MYSDIMYVIPNHAEYHQWQQLYHVGLVWASDFWVWRHIPMLHIPTATFTHATFTHRRHLPIASIRYDAWSIRYLIVVAYGYLSRENWDLIEAMGKCRLWVNVAWVNVAMGICHMGICRLTDYITIFSKQVNLMFDSATYMYQIFSSWFGNCFRTGPWIEWAGAWDAEHTCQSTAGLA